MGGRPSLGQTPARQPTPCELTNRCCGLSNSKCCVGGKKCYTKWERVCDKEDNPECRVRLTQKCFPQKVRDCRVVPEFKEYSFMAETCSPRPLTQCFDYRKKVCVPASRTEQRRVAWVNEILTVNTKQIFLC
jgi:hypothetical protein